LNRAVAEVEDLASRVVLLKGRFAQQKVSVNARSKIRRCLPRISRGHSPNRMRTENSAIPCRDGCAIQVIPSSPSAKILSRGLRAAYMHILRMEEPGRFHDASLVRIRQPDRTGGAALPVANEKGRDLRLWCEFWRLAFPSRVRDACGPRGSSEYTQRAGVSGGVRQLQ